MRLKIKSISIKVSIALMALVAITIISLQFRSHPTLPPYLSYVIPPDKEFKLVKVNETNYELMWEESYDEIIIGLRDSFDDSKEFKPISILDGRIVQKYNIPTLNPTSRPYLQITYRPSKNATEKLFISNRVLEINGSINFRDIGGFRGSNGKQIRWGKIFRSGELSNLGEIGLRQIAKLNIGEVYDLRHKNEIEQARDRLPKSIKRSNLEIYNKDEEPGGFWKSISRYKLDSYWDSFNYDFLAVKKGNNFGKLLKAVAKNEAAGAILIHCTTGKDRTGIAIALLLLALGVSEEIISDDYSLSNLYFPEILAYAEKRYRAYSQSVELLNIEAIDIYPFFLAKKETIQKVMKNIRRDYGSYDHYFKEVIGIDESVISELRNKYLMP